MIATITITRRDERGEDRDFLVDIERDRDGDIFATCGEDVDELRTTNRYGSIETHATGRLFQHKGDPIELEDDELLEAGQALTQLEALWHAERARLKQIFRPAGGNSLQPATPHALEAAEGLSQAGAVDPTALHGGLELTTNCPAIPNLNPTTQET